MKKIITFILILVFLSFSYSKSYYQNVRFTSYHPNDKTGSTKCTASGYCTKHFDIHKEGFYTFNNKVVIATANKNCTKSKTGVCANYNSLPKGYHEYDLYDELDIYFNNKEYKAIVLDICGACYWEEEYQRYDIFVSNKTNIIDTLGTVLIKEKYHYFPIFMSLILFIILLIQLNIININKIIKILRKKRI